uniref:Uncharacterized protein n=1 Tax=Nicotiana tabacum TaxID=4097 RepID=A0A1S4ASZ8_TOBAC|nr:PREDICTED: uncharacterized protein LOC107801055 [Nicotiana tabacum]
MGRHTVQKSARVLELDVVSALSAQISTLTNQVNQMTLVINKQQAQLVQQVQLFCEVCGEGHTSDLCPVNPESVCFVGNANRGQTNQYGNTYNINWRYHPNFSWGRNQGAQNEYMPQAPQQQYRPPQAEQYANSTSHLEEIMKKFMADQQAQTAEMMKKVMADHAQNTRPVGALPSDTEANTKASINVVSLRNGRQLEEVQSKKRKQVTFNEKSVTIEAELEKLKETEKSTEETVAKQPPPLVARPPPLFPRRLQKVKDNAAYKKFLDILKQVQINIPLVDILQEVPKYTKYIKDIVANKRRLTKFKIVELTEECSSRVQSKLPQKLKDPGSFTIQISIGVIENVLVQVGSFIFPGDFIILDYDPDQEVPFILGHPFLATGRAIIYVCEGKMTMRVGDRVEVLHSDCLPTMKSYL